MKIIVLAASVLMLACSSVSAAEKSWFTPQLTAGDPSECAPLLNGVRKEFEDEDNWEHSLKPLGTIAGLNVISIEPDDKRIAKPATTDRLFLLENMAGCHGCDAFSVTVLSQGRAAFSTPGSFNWTEYSNGKTKDYLVGFVEDRVEVYAVARTQAKALACKIGLAPDLGKMTDPDVVRALQAVDSLARAASGMARGGGFCGTSATDGRWADNRTQALHTALYRPWAVRAWNDPNSANSYGDYDRILPQLRQWSLGGFSEQAAFQHYKDQIAATETILTDFYTKRFGWPADKAKDMAHAALTNAVAAGFGFYMYQPFENDEEERLRTALFSHAPMADIEAVPLDVKVMDAATAKEWPNEAKDSLLNAAIAYPGALRYLLGKGFDPNRANPFGKTPLMYAAQYNQLEAARILLEAGADPNARTTKPPRDCGYTLKTTGMTPLHYAVRNGAAPLIQALLKSGAVTFIKSHKDDWRDMRDDAPLDWLHRYTSGETGKEQNPNLATQDAAILEKALVLPDAAALAKIASAQTLLGEKQSAAGHNEAAYQAITVALQADPGNQKALADLPLLAFKTGREAEAAAAATRATTALQTDAGKASAWFNLGLVCQKQAESLSFDGKRYCIYDRVDPFVRAFKIAPADGRANKLVQVMEKDAIAGRTLFCAQQGRAYRVMHEQIGDRSLTRVYVLHPAAETVDAASIGWTIKYPDRPATFYSPAITERYVLGNQAMTVLESDRWGQKMTVGGQACEMK